MPTAASCAGTIQFTPHDVHDWDATEGPDPRRLPDRGQQRKVVMFANRNGFYYTIDRTTGKVITGKPFVTTTWATEIGRDGRPMALPGHTPDENGETTCPDITGGTNFWPPAFDPTTRTFFVNAREACMMFYSWKPDYKAGERFTGGAGQRVESAKMPVYGALRAIDPATGERKWEFKYLGLSTAGLLTTASGLIFTGDNDGNLLALDSRSGKLLWALSDGRAAARHVADHLHVDGRQHLLAGGNDAHRVGPARELIASNDAARTHGPRTRAPADAASRVRTHCVESQKSRSPLPFDLDIGMPSARPRFPDDLDPGPLVAEPPPVACQRDGGDLTIALTLGAGGSIFAVVQAVLLTPPPFTDQDALSSSRNKKRRSIRRATPYVSPRSRRGARARERWPHSKRSMERT
jgi:hypothetical protein